MTAIQTHDRRKSRTASIVLLSLMAAGCWGINVSGELGDGTTSERTGVRNVVGLP